MTAAAKIKTQKSVMPIVNVSAGRKNTAVPGVTYSPVTGARCPLCKTPRGGIYRTMPYESGTRIRYHICRRCGKTFKSVESIMDEVQRYREEALARSMGKKSKSQV